LALYYRCKKNSETLKRGVNMIYSILEKIEYLTYNGYLYVRIVRYGDVFTDKVYTIEYVACGGVTPKWDDILECVDCGNVEHIDTLLIPEHKKWIEF
jgi:hypothetical protein